MIAINSVSLCRDSPRFLNVFFSYYPFFAGVLGIHLKKVGFGERLEVRDPKDEREMVADLELLRIMGFLSQRGKLKVCIIFTISYESSLKM